MCRCLVHPQVLAKLPRVVEIKPPTPTIRIAPLISRPWPLRNRHRARGAAALADGVSVLNCQRGAVRAAGDSGFLGYDLDGFVPGHTATRADVRILWHRLRWGNRVLISHVG